jgi:hypothetical protein
MRKAKEFIQKRLANPIRSIGKSRPLRRLMPVGLVPLLSTLPLASLPNRGTMAYAQLGTQLQQQQQQQSLMDPWSEALRVAHSKVEAATAPGAFGHGVPGLHGYGLSPQDLLLAFAVAAAGSILVYAAINSWLNRKEKKLVKRSSSSQLMASAP